MCALCNLLFSRRESSVVCAMRFFFLFSLEISYPSLQDDLMTDPIAGGREVGKTFCSHSLKIA